MEGEQNNSAYEHLWNEDSSVGIVPRALQHIFTELESQVLLDNGEFIIFMGFNNLIVLFIHLLNQFLNFFYIVVPSRFVT